MSYIYFGSDKFSCMVLDGVCRAGFRPDLVVTQPDRPKGRHLKPAATMVGVYARENSLPIIKPQDIKAQVFLDDIRTRKPGFLVIADYGNLIPQDVLSAAEILPVAVHPSLLPLYRGATPLNRVLINGDKETGVTLFKAVKAMDSGPIIAQEKIALLGSEDVAALSEKLAALGPGTPGLPAAPRPAPVAPSPPRERWINRDRGWLKGRR